MRRRLEAYERRLARIAAVVRAWRAPQEAHRRMLRARKVIHGLTREGLRRAGINPEDAVALRPRPDDFEGPPPRRPPWRRPDARELFLEKMHRLAERMRGRPPNLAHASVIELFAYYVCGEGAREAPA